MDAPVGVVLAIDGLRCSDGGAFIVISAGPRKRQPPSLGSRAGGGGKGAKLGKVKVAVVPAARPALRQAIVGQRFEPKCMQARGGQAGGDNIGVAFGPRAVDEP